MLKDASHDGVEVVGGVELAKVRHHHVGDALAAKERVGTLVGRDLGVRRGLEQLQRPDDRVLPLEEIENGVDAVRVGLAERQHLDDADQHVGVGRQHNVRERRAGRARELEELRQRDVRRAREHLVRGRRHGGPRGALLLLLLQLLLQQLGVEYLLVDGERARYRLREYARQALVLVVGWRCRDRELAVVGLLLLLLLREVSE